MHIQGIYFGHWSKMKPLVAFFNNLCSFGSIYSSMYLLACVLHFIPCSSSDNPPCVSAPVVCDDHLCGNEAIYSRFPGKNLAVSRFCGGFRKWWHLTQRPTAQTIILSDVYIHADEKMWVTILWSTFLTCVDKKTCATHPENNVIAHMCLILRRFDGLLGCVSFTVSINLVADVSFKIAQNEIEGCEGVK